jgi:hypothetical protein
MSPWRPGRCWHISASCSCTPARLPVSVRTIPPLFGRGWCQRESRRSTLRAPAWFSDWRVFARDRERGVSSPPWDSRYLTRSWDCAMVCLYKHRRAENCIGTSGDGPAGSRTDDACFVKEAAHGRQESTEEGSHEPRTALGSVAHVCRPLPGRPTASGSTCLLRRCHERPLCAQDTVPTPLFAIVARSALTRVTS